MIFKREFKRNLKALIIWSIVIGGFTFMMLAIYPQMAAEQQSMQELLKAYPESLKKVFGMDRLDFSTLLGFYGVEVYFMLTLFGSIYAGLLASTIVAKEENEKTIEFLLSKPVARSQIIFEKLSLVVVNLFIFNMVTAIVSLVGFQLSEDSFTMSTFALLSVGAFILHLTFASLSFMLSTMMRKTRNILSISLGIVLGTYFLQVMAGLSEKAEFLRYFTPFKYVDAADIITDQALNPVYMSILLVLIFGSLAAAFFVYQRKDIAV